MVERYGGIAGEVIEHLGSCKNEALAGELAQTTFTRAVWKFETPNKPNTGGSGCGLKARTFREGNNSRIAAAAVNAATLFQVKNLAIFFCPLGCLNIATARRQLKVSWGYGEVRT